MGDTEFGLRADLVLQTDLNGSPAYPNGKTMSSSQIFGLACCPETNVSFLLNGYLKSC
jgi:hypothetical protein